MAEVIKSELQLPDVELVSGAKGEFTVRVGDLIVAQKGYLGFPSENEVIKAVKQNLH